jgi:membrane protein implicated in regulation of membrane protease activity
LGALLSAFLVARVLVSAGATAPPASGFLLATAVSIISIGGFSAVGLQLWWLTIVGLAAIASALLLKGQYRTDRPAADRPSAERPPAERPVAERPNVERPVADFVRESSARPAL